MTQYYELKEIRKQSGYTLRQVEEITGISNPYLSQLETGKIKNPSAMIIYKLAELYKLKMEEIMQSLNMIGIDTPNKKEMTNEEFLRSFKLQKTT